MRRTTSPSCATSRMSASTSRCCSRSMRGLKPSCWKRTSAGLEHIWTYVPPSEIDYPVNFGMTMKDYKAAWDKKYPGGKIEFGFNAVAGYTTALVIEKTLSVATSLDQMDLRKAVFSLSGELKTLDGTFALDEMGGQTGELTPLGQLTLDDHGHVKFVSIYPHETATGKPVYPAP